MDSDIKSVDDEMESMGVQLDQEVYTYDDIEYGNSRQMVSDGEITLVCRRVG